jgi:hypothetical protein
MSGFFGLGGKKKQQQPLGLRHLIQLPLSQYTVTGAFLFLSILKFIFLKYNL